MSKNIDTKKHAVYAYVGTYTTENKKGNRNAHGEGIYVYEIGDEAENWSLVQVVPALNPAVLAFGRDKKYLYCCNTNSGAVSAYSRDEKSGKLLQLNTENTSGSNVMVISVDPMGEWLIAADHKGLVTVFRLEEDGRIGARTDELMLPGEKGPLNEKIQPWSRPHHVPFSPDGRYVLVADKGLDTVHSYRLDRASGKLSAVQALKCHGASCPRHIWWHPNGTWAYVNTEYTSTIIACRYDAAGGLLEPFQLVSALPDDYFDVNNMTSEIVVHPAGMYLYISNRGHESIGVFRIDQENGRLTPLAWENCGGIRPRFFSIEPSGKYLFCGNQSTDNISVFRIDWQKGLLINTGEEIKTPTPVWILFSDPLLHSDDTGDVL